MISNPKWLCLILGNCILLFVVQLINDSLASITINLFPYALFIFIPNILVSFTTGLISVFISGLILDASSSLPLGTTAILLTIIYTIYSCFTQRFKTYSAWHNTLILLSANAIIFAFLSVFIDPVNYSSSYFWGSIIINLLFSQIMILCITPWFLSLQYGLLDALQKTRNNISTSNTQAS